MTLLSFNQVTGGTCPCGDPQANPGLGRHHPTFYKRSAPRSHRGVTDGSHNPPDASYIKHGGDDRDMVEAVCTSGHVVQKDSPHQSIAPGHGGGRGSWSPAPSPTKNY
ncbi:hypothetical protein C0Q70_11911 [Pomacea canaliculata]|uniref:Uncharacterized protein n=1 Tax=Pomacea canaliculata TaxID=400727 RepID=A0A2T7P7A4_POMCA|nr:hypothetical protein C0Q70_11911 [Pomacea canaliculata]